MIQLYHSSGEPDRDHFLALATRVMPSKTKLIWLIYVQGFSDRDWPCIKSTIRVVFAEAKTVHKRFVGGVYDTSNIHYNYVNLSFRRQTIIWTNADLLL